MSRRIARALGAMALVPGSGLTAGVAAEISTAGPAAAACAETPMQGDSQRRFYRLQ